jgi:hypothetical protein
MYETDFETTVLSLEALFDSVLKRHAELIYNNNLLQEASERDPAPDV